MQAIKIEIKREAITTNKTVIEELNYKTMPAILTIEDIAPGENSQVTAEKVTYVLRTVSDGFERRNYFVRETDQGIFNDLMALGNEDLRKNFNKGERRGKLYMLNLFIGFLKLPWYKRLFVKKRIQSLKETEQELFYSNK